MSASDPIDLIKAAFRDDDANRLREILTDHPQLKAMVNDPLFPFDSPAINCARSRAMLDVLLDAGADINAKSRWWAGGFGILHGADPDLSAYAIERGAIVDAHAAARLGMIDRLRELIAADPGVVRARGGDGQTPLHFASTIEIVDLLLAHGAGINARDIDHESTPAQWMARDRQPIARHLLERGADADILLAAALGDLPRVREFLRANPSSIRITVSAGSFPMTDPRAGGTIYIWTLGENKSLLQVAREFGRADVFEWIRDQSPPDLRLIGACLEGDESAARALLDADPNLIASLGEEARRAPANAAQDNNTDAVRQMLALGWPVDARSRRHSATALHWAAFHGNAAMAREILKYHPPLEDADNDYKSTPLGWALHGSEHGWYCRTGEYASVVDQLCAAGAKLPDAISGTPAVREVLLRYRGGAA